VAVQEWIESSLEVSAPLCACPNANPEGGQTMSKNRRRKRRD
jgi:hypothetical protein